MKLRLLDLESLIKDIIKENRILSSRYLLLDKLSIIEKEQETNFAKRIKIFKYCKYFVLSLVVFFQFLSIVYMLNSNVDTLLIYFMGVMYMLISALIGEMIDGMFVVESTLSCEFRRLDSLDKDKSVVNKEEDYKCDLNSLRNKVGLNN